MTFTLSPISGSNRLLFANGQKSHELHPLWLRERTMEVSHVDEGNLQRLFVPTELDPEVHAVQVETHQDSTVITWSDDHVMTVDHLRIACLLYTSPSPRDRTRSRMPSSA